MTKGEVIALIKALGGSGGGGSGGGGALMVTDTEGSLDKTWQEIHDADFAIVKVVVGEAVYINGVVSIYTEDGRYYIAAGTEDVYSTDSANSYPQLY